MGLFAKPSNVEVSVKRVLSTLSIALMAAFFFGVCSSPVMAKVTGQCGNCHTMHYSQGGTTLSDWGADGPHETLLVNTCVGCHSGEIVTNAYYELGGCNVPIVYHTGGSAPPNYLAGGNFWWVADDGGDDDTKGHNVLGISGEDLYLTMAGPKEAPGNQQGCGGNGCHYSLARMDQQHQAHDGKSGCEGCHFYVSHHDSGTPNTATSAYRFLEGHNPNCYVIGKEDPYWEANASPTEHNEYKGDPDDFAWDGDGFSNLQQSHNMSSYCKGCHSNFHWQTASKTDPTWVRHPSDAVLPTIGEYAAYTTYNPVAPVARPSSKDIFDWSGSSSTVIPGTDMVMCLSCHRPHGSPYPDMLRWDYDTMNAGSGSNGNGCFVCHTSKDGVAGNP